MNIDHEKLEKLARMLCESSVEDKGRYDRKGCKRNHWRKKALAFQARVSESYVSLGIYRAVGWPV